MVEHGLYTIKREFLELIHSLGGQCDMENGDKRPMYCCIKDSRIEGLYWAIPTTDISHRTDGQKEHYQICLSKSNKDLRSCYYHIGRTTKKAVYKISSCYPITEKYINKPFVSLGQHVVIQRQSDIDDIERKLKKILSFEFRNNNYFNQRITDIREYLINELQE